MFAMRCAIGKEALRRRSKVRSGRGSSSDIEARGRFFIATTQHRDATYGPSLRQAH